MRVFAERAATELQRKWAEDEKRRAYEELEFRVEERTEQLRQAKEAADAASRARGDFLANMSHELRTPLNAILGLAQLLSQDKTLSSDHQCYLKTIDDSGEHLLELINEVLEMSKIEVGMLTRHESNFNLRHLLDSLKDMLNIKAISKELCFRVEYGSNLPNVNKNWLLAKSTRSF
jgi:two-component system, sensor histidine kinase and response regulator